jgi:hypothetical protein
LFNCIELKTAILVACKKSDNFKIKTMNNKIIKLINDYWRFDNNQDNLSTWHDKNELIKEIEAINFTDSCEKLKDCDKTDFERWKNECFDKNKDGYVNRFSLQFTSEEQLIHLYNNKYK